MNILCVCQQGRNRSRHAAQFLAKQGHETDFAGIHPLSLNRVRQQRIDWADVIIPVTPAIGDALKEAYDLAGKRVVTLHATRDPADLSRFEAQNVYEQIERELQECLPLER